MGWCEQWRRDDKMAKVSEDGHAPDAKKRRQDDKVANMAIPGQMR